MRKRYPRGKILNLRNTHEKKILNLGNTRNLGLYLIETGMVMVLSAASK